MRKWLREHGRVVLPLAVMVLAAGCASSRFKDVPSVGEEGDSFSSGSGIEAPVYALQPGDTITVVLYQRSDMTPLLEIRGTPVGPDGRISVPMVGDIPVAGLTLGDVRGRVREAFAPHFVSPVVHAELVGAEGYQVSVLGEVVKPGRYPIQWGAPVIDVVLKAGGFGPNADVGRVILLRPTPRSDGASKHAAKLDLEKLFTEAQIRQNVALHAGDIVYVPATGLARSAGFHRHVSDILSPYVSVLQTVGNIFLIDKALDDE